jgi:hypothetical protein
MSTARRRARRDSNVPRPELARRDQHAPSKAPPVKPAATAAGGPRPLPQWRWRTFPVFFALSLGLFLGVFLGTAAAVASDNGNDVAATIIFLASAAMLGLAFSRITVRWIVSRNWVKPRS